MNCSVKNSISLQRGNRLKNGIRHSNGDSPLVTIITATYNAAAHLPKTIKSVRELKYKNFEWIIIDCKSTDNTVDLLRNNEDIIDYWISEPDDGIYHAWNKGLSKANGEWIAFLGAGDTYMDHAITSYINAIYTSTPRANFASARVRLVNDADIIFREFGSRFDWHVFKKYMNIAHVGSLHHRELFDKCGQFDEKYRSSGDYDFLMRCGPMIIPLYLNKVTAVMLKDGESDGVNAMKETFEIQKKYISFLTAMRYYIIARTKRLFRPFFRGY